MLREDGHSYMALHMVISNRCLSLCSNMSGILLYDTHLNVIIMESRSVIMTPDGKPGTRSNCLYMDTSMYLFQEVPREVSMLLHVYRHVGCIHAQVQASAYTVGACVDVVTRHFPPFASRHAGTRIGAGTYYDISSSNTTLHSRGRLDSPGVWTF